MGGEGNARRRNDLLQTAGAPSSHLMTSNWLSEQWRQRREDGAAAHRVNLMQSRRAATYLGFYEKMTGFQRSASPTGERRQAFWMAALILKKNLEIRVFKHLLYYLKTRVYVSNVKLHFKTLSFRYRNEHLKGSNAHLNVCLTQALEDNKKIISLLSNVPKPALKHNNLENLGRRAHHPGRLSPRSGRRWSRSRSTCSVSGHSTTFWPASRRSLWGWRRWLHLRGKQNILFKCETSVIRLLMDYAAFQLFITLTE